MRARGVGLLAALGVVAVAGGWYFGTRTTPSEQTTVAGAKLMFPDLPPALQAATRVEITHQGKQTVIEKRPDGGWGVAAMHDYPVQEAKLRGLFTGLTELRLAEPRTSDPTEFSRLGVDDPNAPSSSADLLQIMDAGGKPVLALIVGHRRVRSQANAPEEVYVRRPDENQSWLAEGTLQVDADPTMWLDRDVMNISHDRIASVVVGNGADGGNGLQFARADDGKFALTEPSDHPRLETYKVDDVARALELLTFQAVKADAAAPGADAPGTEAGHSVFTTTDGLAVTVTVLHADKDVWARFAVTGLPDKVKAGDKVAAEADRLKARLAGWSYQIGSWKEKSLVPTMDDLKAPEPANAPQSASPAQSANPALLSNPAQSAASAKPADPAGSANPAGSPAAAPPPNPADTAKPAEPSTTAAPDTDKK